MLEDLLCWPNVDLRVLKCYDIWYMGTRVNSDFQEMVFNGDFSQGDLFWNPGPQCWIAGGKGHFAGVGHGIIDSDNYIVATPDDFTIEFTIEELVDCVMWCSFAGTWSRVVTTVGKHTFIITPVAMGPQTLRLSFQSIPGPGSGRIDDVNITRLGEEVALKYNFMPQPSGLFDDSPSDGIKRWLIIATPFDKTSCLVKYDPALDV